MNFFNLIRRSNFQQKKINPFHQIRKLHVKPFEENNFLKLGYKYPITRKMSAKPDSEVSEGLPFKTFRFLPRNGQEKKDSAIIVLQEWWGITEQVKIHAQRIADNTNILTVAPDLYKGKLGLSQEEAKHMMSNLDWKQALVELETLVDSLKKENREKIGSIGFCMGGAVSLALASHLVPKKPLSAVVTCYGIPSPTICDISVIAVTTPVQGHFGNEDNMTGFSDPNAVSSLVRQLEEGIERVDEPGKEIAIYRYDGQGHAFLNDEEWALKMRKEQGFVGGDDEIKSLAWKRIYEFFNKYL
uniref:Protein usf n=1 Tax=Anthurium amnicola TaxID=1678845 RepID=A0A1D1XSX4_9ARAE